MNPIRTWRERAGLAADYPLDCATAVERAMVEEIAELREAIDTLKKFVAESKNSIKIVE